MTARGEATTIEPERSLQRQGRRAAEARATMPDLVMTREVAVSGDHPGEQLIATFARAVRQTPGANAAYRDAQIEHYDRINVGVLVADGTGSTMVTIADADSKTAPEIAAERAALSAKVADASITAPETSGSTCTVTDLSASGVRSLAPVLTPPHALALGIGGRRAGNAITITLTCDQRVLSPFAAANLLDTIADALE